jgi:adenylyl-sulfate kinase
VPLTNGQVFWIFGLSGAGKSTVATSLIDELRNQHIPVLALDGDALRTGLCRGLGFTDHDRAENLRRAAEVARLGADSGMCVVASFITPLELHRNLIRQIVGPDRIAMIFADAPLEVCRQRDVKGLYARALAGQVSEMTGVSSAFEIPSCMELRLPTASMPPAASAQILLDYAQMRLV